jgi:LemA protein
MKKTKAINLLVIVMALFGLSSCGYNKMVSLDEKTQQSWAQVENVYQRRADLIPNLVNTVKGAADFERQTLNEVIEARAKATSINLNAENLTPENIAMFQQAQDRLSSSLSRLLVVAEQYPDLKANKNFLELQAQLEGTENRIAVERKRFNEAVQEYNSYIRSFPQNFIAGWFNFEKKGYFQARPGADVAPEVQF